MKHLEDESRESNIDCSQGTQNLAVKTEQMDGPIARGRSFWLGEGAAGTDPRVHMIYRETELSESDSSKDSTSELLAELARDFPDIAEEVEAERKEGERKRVEKRLRRRKVPGPISFNSVWRRGREVSKKKKKKVEKSEREIKQKAKWRRKKYDE